MTELIRIISEQQAGHESEARFMIGEQLKDIATREPMTVDILIKDLTTEGMGLDGAEGALKKYADKHHGKAGCFCISPAVAEGILREFYGLPEINEGQKVQVEDTASDFIDLAALL